MNPQITETIVTGMTKGELAAVISLVIIAIGVLIGALGYILRLHLKPLENLPKDVAELKSKVLGVNQLEQMIDTKILECQINCPLRQVHLEKKEHEG